MSDIRTITDVSSKLVRIPLKKPIGFSTRRVDHREYVLAYVTSSDGTKGVGWTYAGSVGGTVVKHAIDELLSGHVVGIPVAGISSWTRGALQEFLLVGRQGAILRAVSALEIACWDLLGKQADLPLRELLGSAADSVPAYASGGYYSAGDPLAAIEGELSRYQSLGFTDFKIKVGGASLKVDVARVAKAREVIGPDSRLAIDVNNGWRDLAEARRAVDAFAPYDIWWVEEPFSPDDVRNHALLNARSPMPVATGEIEADVLAFGRLIESHAAAILQPDACVMGGIGRWLQVARAAETFALPVAPHWHANLHAQLAAAVGNCLAVEYFATEEGVLNFEDIVTNRLQVRDGRILLGREPGVGVVFDDDAIRRFEVAVRS